MWDWLGHPVVQSLLSLVVLSAVAYGGWRILQALRPVTGKDDTNVEPLDANLEDLLRQGDIDETELRSIKAVLGKKAKQRASE